MARTKLILALVCLGMTGIWSASGSETQTTQTEHPVRIHPTALLVWNVDSSEYLGTTIREATGDNTYLTSVAVAPWNSDRMIVSTTFHGLYETTDGGVTWLVLGDAGQIEPLYRGSGFFEDVAAVAYHGNSADQLAVELSTTGEVLLINRREGSSAVQAREAGAVAYEESLAQAIRVRWQDYPPIDEAGSRRRELAADRDSFYLSPWQTSPERLEFHMNFAKEHEMNAVVVDFKDDEGRIVYNSQLPMHREIGAVADVFDAERVIRTVHDNDLYLIARIVVFKDKLLYAADANRYAVWDRRLDRPWAVYRNDVAVEYWVDPFSEEVWEYNLAVAEELESLGVDEIQFDYIRTPADGRTWDIVYRHHDGSAVMENDDPFVDDRVEALSGFLARARDRLTVPIGIDVFGFNAWYRMGYLGQDIGALARYVDVISPMLYPSHFARDFADELSYIPRARYLYEQGVSRALRITNGHVLIRPYIQAFLIGGELNFDEPEYTRYLKEQVRGAAEAGASGFTLWNNSGRYYMTSQGIR